MKPTSLSLCADSSIMEVSGLVPKYSAILRKSSLQAHTSLSSIRAHIPDKRVVKKSHESCNTNPQVAHSPVALLLSQIGVRPHPLYGEWFPSSPLSPAT